MANRTSESLTSSDSVAQTLALLQPWIDFVPQPQRRLGLYIFLALLAHLAAFFYIRIDNTRAELQHQTRVHVTMEYPRSLEVESTDESKFWDPITDPRFFLLPLNPLQNLNPDSHTTHLNSNLGSDELPPPAPPENYRTSLPMIAPLEERVEATMHPARQPFSYDQNPPVISTKSVWTWDASLAQRQPTGLPELPSPISDTDLTPTMMRVAINPSGTVEHVLVEQSSGNLGASVAKDIDQQAVLAARKIRFKPTDHQGLEWGIVTVFWHYSSKPREEVVPTPPSSQ